jgi:hypothetical protein
MNKPAPSLATEAAAIVQLAWGVLLLLAGIGLCLSALDDAAGRAVLGVGCLVLFSRIKPL